MAKFPSVKARALRRVLERPPLGYRCTRRSGSHLQLEAEGRPRLLFAFHDGETVAPGLVRHILVRQVGLTGQTGMQTMWAAATVKVVGAGMDDDRFLESVSRLIGDHDVATRSVNQGSNNHGQAISLRRQRILPVEDLRQQPKGTGAWCRRTMRTGASCRSTGCLRRRRRRTTMVGVVERSRCGRRNDLQQCLRASGRTLPFTAQ